MDAPAAVAGGEDFFSASSHWWANLLNQAKRLAAQNTSTNPCWCGWGEGGSSGHQWRTACATSYRGRQLQGPQLWALGPPTAEAVASGWCGWRRGPSVWAPAAAYLGRVRGGGGGPRWPARASASPTRVPSPYGRVLLGREMEGYARGAGDEESESLRETKKITRAGGLTSGRERERESRVGSVWDGRSDED